MVAWRGVVVDGEVWAWPTILLSHEQAFTTFPPLRSYTARWRQWAPGDEIDFDRGVSDEDRAKVEAWVEAVSG